MKQNILGVYLKNLRAEKGYSLRRVGDETGVSASYIYRIETGERQNPTITVLKRLSEFYNVDIFKLISIL